MNWLHKTSGNSYNGTLYHGTNKAFDSFDMSFIGLRDWGDFGVGFYFSTTPGLAISYAYEVAKRNGGKSIIYVVKSNLRNVATFEELMEVIDSVGIPREKVLTPGTQQTRPEQDSRDIRTRMMESGFDGAMVGRQMVVYDASTLKIVNTVTPEQATDLL